ncbi:hypothetical protein BJ166DRAFT_24402 [Pestalotiopsis sp. NC0098]|nr:hypothetical protein BJ166DRAFT_24402 [Pestalotiopsis sp. NC0098]
MYDDACLSGSDTLLFFRQRRANHAGDPGHPLTKRNGRTRRWETRSAMRSRWKPKCFRLCNPLMDARSSKERQNKQDSRRVRRPKEQRISIAVYCLTATLPNSSDIKLLTRRSSVSGQKPKKMRSNQSCAVVAFLSKAMILARTYLKRLCVMCLLKLSRSVPYKTRTAWTFDLCHAVQVQSTKEKLARMYDDCSLQTQNPGMGGLGWTWSRLVNSHFLRTEGSFRII